MQHAIPFMDYRARLEKVEKRAAFIGVTLKSLCDEAGEASNNIYRWKRGEVDPQIGFFGRVMSKLEAELDRRESAIFFSLAPKFLPAEILAQLDLAKAEPAPANGAPREEARP